MKDKNRLLCGAAALLLLTLTTPTNVRGDTAQDQKTTSNPAPETPVGKANKASNLIGMEVRNPQNEKLGDIKDLVVDLHSGRIAYAVLSVGGFLGIGDKYVAVPASAFSVAPTQNELVLNADKAKIQNAPSFAKNDWPDINSASWRTESAYWLSPGTAQGAAGSTHSGSAMGSSLSNPNSSTAHGTATVPADRHNASATDRDTFRGRITAIDPEHRTMTVQGPSGSREFKVSEHSVITTKDNRNPRLSDLKVGYPVVVGYSEENGTYTANTVTRADTPEVK